MLLQDGESTRGAGGLGRQDNGVSAIEGQRNSSAPLWSLRNAAAIRQSALCREAPEPPPFCSQQLREREGIPSTSLRALTLQRLILAFIYCKLPLVLDECVWMKVTKAKEMGDSEWGERWQARAEAGVPSLLPSPSAGPVFPRGLSSTGSPAAGCFEAIKVLD